MAETPHRFDRGAVTRLITEFLDWEWQEMVSIAWWDPPVSGIPANKAISAACELRGALEVAIRDVGTIHGVFGEGLDSEAFITAAIQAHYRQREGVINPHSDPNWRMATVVKDTWQTLFLGPQRWNAQRMIVGVASAARLSPDVSKRADELLQRLKVSTIRRYDPATPKLLEEIVEFLTLYLPKEESLKDSGWTDEAGTIMQRVVFSVEEPSSTTKTRGRRVAAEKAKQRSQVVER
jgi:hypothetical protein